MPASAIVDIRNTYGALLIGLIVSTILYGVTIAQTWNYYWYYRNRDGKALQGFVAFLFSLDTLHTFYAYLVLNFGNVENLYMDVWAIEAQTEINTFVGLLVQLSVPSSVLLLGSCPNVEQLLCETIVSHEQQHGLPAIIFVVRPTSLIYTTLFWMMGKCYVNSFLAMLNNRKSLRERSNDDHTADCLSMPSIRQSGRPYKSRSVPTAVAVAVHRTATTDFGFANDNYDQEANTREFEKLEEGIATSSAHEAESIV
ncbi:hypothetical protein BC826DRAFT_1108063 [Russula brevipes]|nr:hypothetical protein BC826DRAFT_1108063 [Russula brevipes]